MYLGIQGVQDYPLVLEYQVNLGDLVYQVGLWFQGSQVNQVVQVHPGKFKGENKVAKLHNNFR